jgi:hypothetical protein
MAGLDFRDRELPIVARAHRLSGDGH